MRLLIAEDNLDIARALVTILEKEHYCVDAVADGNEAYQYGSSGNYDGIILDIMMPGMDGIEVLKRLRSGGVRTPVLLLTAKSEVDDRVAGLDAGADDYLAKPFAISELMARVRAMLRRRGDFQPEVCEFGGITLNKATYELICQEQSVRLVSREFQMMEMLMERPGQIISTSQFMEHIWGWDSNVEVSIVWVIVSNLRKKLNMLDAAPRIRAVRGVGYCLEEQ